MKTVVLLSGGLDSTVLLAHRLALGDSVHALCVGYGQRHRREVWAATAVAGHYGVGFEVVELPPTLMKGSVLTGGGPVPHGHYEDASMRSTVVPARNLVLLSLAAAVAFREGVDAVAYAAHAGDHAVYPDCRPAFVEAVRLTLARCDYRPVTLLTPFVGRTKADVVAEGRRLGVPFELTWSCYEGGCLHCGLCGTCVERREAFRVAGVFDPTVYTICGERTV